MVILGSYGLAPGFGPQRGNRQPVRYIVVRDPDIKVQLGEWYRDIWTTVVAMASRGEYRVGRGAGTMLGAGTHPSEHFAETPVVIVVCAVLNDLARTDTSTGDEAHPGSTVMFEYRL
jgi:nitroreductase